MKKKSIRFTSCPKTYTVDQDKAIRPEKTLEHFYARISSLDMKILAEVRRIDNGRLDIPVFFSVCGEDAQALTGTKKQMGKGASPVQAEASACMELAERFSFFAFKDNPGNFLCGDYKSMAKAGYPVLGLDYLLHSVHDRSTPVDRLEQLLAGIPMQWVWGTNISRDKDVLIPFSWFFAINEFNGPSAGNTLEEAALQGICEIVERHVCSKVNALHLATPQIDRQSVQDPVARELLAKFDAQNIELYLNDFTLDTGICTVAALAIDRSTFPGNSEIVYTAGTTPDPEKSLIRAVTEVAQLAGDFNTDSNYVASGLPKPLTMEEVAYLTDSQETVHIAKMARLADNDIREEISNCLRALDKIGFEVLMIDVTHERLALPALYTIIPGAHFRERSMICDAGLFAAKLLMELVDNVELREEKLLEMAELLPNSYYIEFYRGRNFAEAAFPEVAVNHFSRALEMVPQADDFPVICSYLGGCLRDLERYQEAMEILERGLASDEERPDLHNTMGVCLFKSARYEEAIHHFQRAVDLNPASAIDYANLGVNYSKIGNNAAAIEYLTLALTLDPGLDFAKNLLDRLVNE
jgi:ribosomal protein S12 methylthiotransferase accessory factor